MYYRQSAYGHTKAVHSQVGEQRSLEGGRGRAGLEGVAGRMRPAGRQLDNPDVCSFLRPNFAILLHPERVR